VCRSAAPRQTERRCAAPPPRVRFATALHFLTLERNEAVRRLMLLSAVASIAAVPVAAQDTTGWTRADTLRGDFTTPGRAWWDVTFYDLHTAIRPADSSISGSNAITYRVLEPGTELQIDLMTPLEVDSMVQDGRRVEFRREGNAFFARPPAARAGDVKTIAVFYHGRPRIAKRPPWEGGFTWGADSLGRTWVVTTDQGMGASVWWPNKDTQADEPDSMRIAITVPRPLVNVSNGRLRRVTPHPDGTTTWEWFVANPINNYAVAIAAGHYAHWSETLEGERGTLTLDFWPLDYNLDAARRQWVQARPTLQCFEEWFGPYPWYEDGYKLIEVSNNGMEHQSAVAYGNGYANGYRGRDGSGTGLGMEFDFIIVHETAHEWWGNNITTNDLADMWVHEGFGNYSEGIYVECLFGREAGARYIIGNRRLIRNDRPIIPGAYGVNAQGSGDMYPKGGNMLHTIRQLVGDDAKWRAILRGLNTEFRHSIVTGRQVQDYISRHAGMDLSKVFEQYLTTTEVPVLEHRVTGSALEYRWTGVVPGFAMPVEVTLGGEARTLRPTTGWQSVPLPAGTSSELAVDPDYYVELAP
jgi:aminopeptidase N